MAFAYTWTPGLTRAEILDTEFMEKIISFAREYLENRYVLGEDGLFVEFFTYDIEHDDYNYTIEWWPRSKIEEHLQMRWLMGVTV